MSLILDKYKYKKETSINQKFNKLRNSLKNNKALGKVSNKNAPKPKSFITNKKERRHKSNDVSNTTNNKENNNNDFLLSNKNDPFSRSVIYSHNKNLTHKIASSVKKNKNNRKTYSNNNNRYKLSNKNNSNFKLNTSNKRFNNSEFKSNTINVNETYSKNERYDSIENKIIDKNYENDIDHDEIIIGSDKNNNTKNKNKKAISNSLFEAIHLNSEIKDEKKETSKNDEYNEDDYSPDNNFENNRNDFIIMYIDNYTKIINDDMLSMELQLLYEKILELQNSYHAEYIKIFNKYNENKKYISLIIFKYKDIQKKIFNLLKIKEKLNGANQLNNFFDKRKKENRLSLKVINDKEINLWKNMLIGMDNNFKNKKYRNAENKKDIKELFKRIAFDKYSSLKNNLNDIENKIIVNLMKKNNYKIKSDKKAKNRSYNKSYNNNNSNKYKNKYEKITAIKPKKVSNYKLYDFTTIFGNTRTKKTYSKNKKFRTNNINASLVKKTY